ncbi:pimeloyl-ACP methyl ester carboxylesterase [Streptomyces sp. V3I8]|uniref:alpha/beta fold hydrolase n=1 Tax=Streptomyces sp. V3I8 TaxID=3042279 RepID=UPI002783DBFB|nr:alpha/beta hydrolase [Streptomyces sp. V3I8]MDQ1033832.1 pimeloyl-ACP methyl ester carboxylesterase [Streptomyces sp. V3I8]
MPTTRAAWKPPEWNVPERTREELVPLRWRGLRYTCRVITSDRPPATEPLLLLGGALQDMYAWPRLERRLSAHMPLVFVDLPGVGTADDLPVEQGFDALAEAALAVADRLGYDRINLLGASYGAPIAYRAALSRPATIARLVLAGATHRMNPRLVSDCEQVWSARAALADDADGSVSDSGSHEIAAHAVAALLNTGAGDRVAQGPAVARMLHRQFARITPAEARRHAVCHQRLRAADLLPSAAVDAVRALVFTGEHDDVSTPDENRAVAAAIAHSTFLLVHDADHMVHLEREAEYADLVLRFLTDLPLDDLPYATAPEYFGRSVPGAR